MKQATVMVVDPDRESLAHTEEILTVAGYAVLGREMAVGTAGAILRSRPDLVLLELSMPLLDGAEIVSSIRRSRQVRDTRMVLCAALPQEEITRVAKQARADAGLARPFEPAALLETVHHWVRPRRNADTSRSGTRQREGYLLVASNHMTRRVLRGTLGARASAIFTDSGTEALRLIFSPDPPRMVLVGTSILDLPFELIWRKAVERDPTWHERFVIIEERPATATGGRVLPEMLVWDRDDDPGRLIELFDRVAQAI